MRDGVLFCFQSLIITKKAFSLSSIINIRDVKMGFNLWANSVHHGFEPGWVEKNLTLLKVGWTQPGSLNPRVKRVRAGLKVGWPT